MPTRFTMKIEYPGRSGTVCRSDVPNTGGCGKPIGMNEPCITLIGYNLSFRQHISCHLKWIEEQTLNAKPRAPRRKVVAGEKEAEGDGNP